MTAQTAEKRWTSHAEYSVPDQANVQVKPPEATYPSEEEARQAALQTAVESIDRGRVSIGKP